MGIFILVVLIIVAFFMFVNGRNAKNFINEEIYEERPFRIVRKVTMSGLFGMKFKDIFLYDLDRNEYGEIAEESPLFIEIAKSLMGEININIDKPDFDVREVFSNMCDKKSPSYSVYVHIMRCVTNINWEAFVMKGNRYDFSRMDKDVLKATEEHTDKIIVEVGSHIVQRVSEMMKE